ncbi:MAG TPA: RNA pyrophosphohydrolase [Dongiaceae bacterium]|jgi:putative (di)nucleoside polyphosphate hydrolase
MKYPPPSALSAEQIARLPYRPGVGIMLINQKGQVFIAQRIDNPGPAWQMPQGGIDKREEPLQAAWREMREEVGTDRARFIGESRDWFTYDLPAELVPQLWKGKFRGQRQKWFAFRFLGTDRDINIATERPEFSSWRWADLEDLPGLIVPFKRRLYEELIAEFKPLIRR